LGMQDVSVTGVPAGSHYARILVEADYMLKRISIGLEPSGLRDIKSHLATLRGVATVRSAGGSRRSTMLSQRQPTGMHFNSQDSGCR